MVLRRVDHNGSTAPAALDALVIVIRKDFEFVVDGSEIREEGKEIEVPGHVGYLGHAGDGG